MSGTYEDIIGVYRPQSLSVVHNNNGWIRIKPDGSNLPGHIEMCHFVPVNHFDEQFIGWIDKDMDEVYFIDPIAYASSSVSGIDSVMPNAWLTSQITHYQPIVKPQPPIY